MIFDEGSRLVERALSLEDAVENAHSKRRATPAFGNLTNIPSQYWNQNQSHQSFPSGLPYPSLQPFTNCIHQVSCSGLNSQQIEDYSVRDEPTRAYCSKHVGYLKRVWRSHDCEFRASACTSELEKAGWKHTNGKYFCKSCSPVKKNLYRHVKNMELISSNVANVQTTDNGDGQPYRRLEAILKTDGDGMGGVSLDEITMDMSDFLKILKPGDPRADAQGYVTMPNVKLGTEMINLSTAASAYQANIAVLNRYQKMVETTLELLK